MSGAAACAGAAGLGRAHEYCLAAAASGLFHRGDEPTSDDPDLAAWVRGHLGRVLGIAPNLVALDRTLADYGLDSVDAVLMAGELEEAFGIEIDPAGFIQFDTIEAMVLGLTPVVKAALARRRGA